MLFISLFLTFMVFIFIKKNKDREPRIWKLTKRNIDKRNECYDRNYEFLLSEVIELVNIGFSPNEAYKSVLGIKSKNISRKTLSEALRKIQANKTKSLNIKEEIIRKIDFFFPELIRQKKENEVFIDVSLYSLELSKRMGIPIIHLLDTAIAIIRGDRNARGEINNAIEGPLSTIKLLSFLPVIGVLLDTFIGVNVFSIYFDFKVGTFCFLLGVFFYLLGMKITKNMINNTIII